MYLYVIYIFFTHTHTHKIQGFGFLLPLQKSASMALRPEPLQMKHTKRTHTLDTALKICRPNIGADNLLD